MGDAGSGGVPKSARRGYLRAALLRVTSCSSGSLASVWRGSVRNEVSAVNDDASVIEVWAK